MSGPATELEVRVLEALEHPRTVGDVLFLFPALKSAGRETVQATVASLAESGLVSAVSGTKLYAPTEKGARWLNEALDWELRCDRVDVASDGVVTVVGRVVQGVVKPGDRFLDGRGATGRVVTVESLDPDAATISMRVESADTLALPLVLRSWEPLAGASDIPSRLQPAEWRPADWEPDLLLDGSLPDVTARFVEGRSWDDVHTAILGSGLRWEHSTGAIVADTLPPASDVFANHERVPSLLKVWVGPLQFNAHYIDADEAEFDIEIEALGDRAKFECLVAFMDWLAAVAGNDAAMTHEGARELRIRSSDVDDDIIAVIDAVRLADLRNPVFLDYREVIAPQARLTKPNVDRWLETHDPDQTSSVLSHVHLYDAIESVDAEQVLARLAQQIAERWREALADQFPDRRFIVDVAGEPDEYGPTVWMRPLHATEANPDVP